MCWPASLINRWPNQAWASDITYIRTRSGWLYLAAVLDLHSRKIVGWAMAPEMPATLVCAALQMAIAQRNPCAGLIGFCRISGQAVRSSMLSV